jgi:hypothetical protein
MNRGELLQFMRAHMYAVQASVSPAGASQAAVVGIVVTDDFEVFFDALDSSRKIHNLRANPAIALVVGGCAGGDERTLQYEGVADEPAGEELARLLALYFERFPDGRDRQRAGGVTYVRVRPTWMRYSDYAAQTPQTPQVLEFRPEDLRAERS